VREDVGSRSQEVGLLDCVEREELGSRSQEVGLLDCVVREDVGSRSPEVGLLDCLICILMINSILKVIVSSSGF